MKKISILSGILLASAMMLSLVGCNDKSKVHLEKVDPYSLESNYRDLRITGTGYKGEQFTDNVKYGKKEKEYHNYVVSDVRVLVVPVDFTNYPSTLYGAGSTQEESELNSRKMLEKVFFGGPEDTAWYSLSEYYKSSSFGTCNVTGVVAPWYHVGVKSTDSSVGTDTGYASKVAVKIQNKYRSPSAPIIDTNGNKYNLADFDANQDGLVDTIVMLYTAPITTTGELWWAFCSSVSGAFGQYTPDGKLEGANRYFWASFNFLFEKGPNIYYTSEEIKNGTAVADAHTMTHEFGHCLSLPDYYITDYNPSDYSALGGLDMMDNNIGDHNAYSKTLYGWINPRRIAGHKGKTTFKLKSTTTTGDAVIIPAPDEWNNTYLDQYLLIEFLTPEGVAKRDGEERYLGYYPLYYNKAGVRISHVDARMGKEVYSSGGWTFSGYTWGYSGLGDQEAVTIAASNTATRSSFPNYKEIEVLPSDGKYMSKGGVNNSDTLYIEGNSFGMNGIYENFKFNGIDGTQEKEFGFKIHIDKIDGNNSATITVSR